jgi:hypothetical protein
VGQDELGVRAAWRNLPVVQELAAMSVESTNPPFQFVETLARIMNVSPAYFYYLDDRLAELILIYSSMPEAERQTLHQFIKNLVGQDLPSLSLNSWCGFL